MKELVSGLKELVSGLKELVSEKNTNQINALHSIDKNR